MDTPDISPQAVERLALICDAEAEALENEGLGGQTDREIAATLRALSARVAKLEGAMAGADKGLTESVNNLAGFLRDDVMNYIASWEGEFCCCAEDYAQAESDRVKADAAADMLEFLLLAQRSTATSETSNAPEHSAEGG